jgi:hypothetical protein
VQCKFVIRGQRSKLAADVRNQLYSAYRNFKDADDKKLYNSTELDVEVAKGLVLSGGYRQAGEDPNGCKAWLKLLQSTAGVFKEEVNKWNASKARALAAAAAEPSTSTAPQQVFLPEINYLPATHIAYVELVVSGYLQFLFFTFSLFMF